MDIETVSKRTGLVKSLADKHRVTQEEADTLLFLAGRSEIAEVACRMIDRGFPYWRVRRALITGARTESEFKLWLETHHG